MSEDRPITHDGYGMSASKEIVCVCVCVWCAAAKRTSPSACHERRLMVMLYMQGTVICVFE